MTTTENVNNDKEILIAIVKEMAESMTGAQSTRHWAEDALWFDIPAPLSLELALRSMDFMIKPRLCLVFIAVKLIAFSKTRVLIYCAAIPPGSRVSCLPPGREPFQR